MKVFLWYRLRGSSLPLPCYTYSDQSRSFGPCADHITGQKIGKGNAKGGGKPGLEVYSWMIDFLLYIIRGPSLPISCHTYSESSDKISSFGPWADHLTGNTIGQGNAKGRGIIRETPSVECNPGASRYRSAVLHLRGLSFWLSPVHTYHIPGKITNGGAPKYFFRWRMVKVGSSVYSAPVGLFACQEGHVLKPSFDQKPGQR